MEKKRSVTNYCTLKKEDEEELEKFLVPLNLFQRDLSKQKFDGGREEEGDKEEESHLESKRIKFFFHSSTTPSTSINTPKAFKTL